MVAEITKTITEKTAVQLKEYPMQDFSLGFVPEATLKQAVVKIKRIKYRVMFITGRAGATVLKIVLMLWIIERKSFLAIQIIKNARTMFIPEIEGVVEMLLTKSCTSKRIPYFEVKPEIQSTIEGETLRSPMQLVRIIIKIGTKEKINPNVHEEAAIPKLF